MSLRLAFFIYIQIISTAVYSQKVEILDQRPPIYSEISDLNYITISGNSISSKDLKNSVIVINIWFVGCKGCKQEEPYLRQIVNQFQNNENFRFVSFCMSTEKRIAKYYSKYGDFGYETVSTTRDVIKEKFNIISSPSHLIIKDGVLVAKYIGPITSSGGGLNWFISQLNNLR